MTPADRRAIFREIDESYETDGYVLDVSDQTIADKLKMPWGWVAKVREENFGPAGPNPKVKKLYDQIAALEQKARTVENDAMKAAEKAEALSNEVKGLKEQLVGLLRGAS